MPGDSVALPLRVQLTDWSTFHASAVIPWWDDYIKITDVSGRLRYVSRFKIVSIQDAHERDLTNQILLGRRSFGEEPAKPPTPPPPRVPENYRVTVVDEGMLRAALVSSWPGDFVRIIDGGGATRYVPAHRVLAVVDSSGTDLTSRVLEQRKSLGMAPPVVRPWRPPARPRSQLSGPIIHGSVLFRADHFDSNLEGPVIFQVDLGGMRRLGNQYGLGATVFYSGDDEVINFGFKARGRRLLGKSFAVDFAPGAILGTESKGSTHSSTPAFICEADVTYKGWLSLAGQVEARNRRYVRYVGFEGSLGTYWESENDWAWYAGMRIGGPAGIPAMVVASLLMAAINSSEATP